MKNKIIKQLSINLKLFCYSFERITRISSEKNIYCKIKSELCKKKTHTQKHIHINYVQNKNLFNVFKNYCV